MTAKYIIGALVVVVFVVWGATAFMKTTIQYVPIEQARQADRTVQVMGKIDFDTKRYDAEKTRLEFALYDADAESPVNAERLNVVYYGVVPGNFDQATSVVAKGKAENGEFVAEQLLVKCPSKYQGEGSEDYQDIEKHQQAQGNSGV